ncbi:hypothetical protein [Flavobacterium sp.]|jgi:hypothetical protein|uniref:hypothetical protein n=1 Tax=Flavobacterium sp. TaxID=239 RepID=UPI0037C0B2E4
MNQKFKLLFSIGTALLFVILGFYLLKKEDNMAVFFGYANIIFFSGIILLSIYKLVRK